MRPYRLTLTILLLLVCPPAVLAQEPAAAKKQAVIRELLEVTGTRESATKIIDSVVAELNNQYPLIVEQLADADPSLTPAQRKEAKRVLGEDRSKFTEKLMERIKQRVDVGKVMEEISSSLYDQYFTEDELKDMIAFYKTPTGKKTLTVMPEYFSASIRMTGEKLMPLITPIIMEIMEEEKSKLKRKK